MLVSLNSISAPQKVALKASSFVMDKDQERYSNNVKELIQYNHCLAYGWLLM